MALHPIAVVDRVLDEYRAYLRTEFRARDPKLRVALEEALDRPLFLAQEPFFQAHRPFKPGKRWRDFGLDPLLAEVMEKRARSAEAYLHQSESIEHLLGPHAGPLVVTTGTGSGKTECFLLPMIQNAIEDAAAFDRSGLTSLIVYPMNALANDQETRINEYLAESGHTYVKVRRYDRTTRQEEREAMRKSPPHILLTNYMMLEYLLVRPADRDALFANHRCRFVVLDEVHTYRGALGANIALLFRRLCAHLKTAVQDWRVEDQSDRKRFPELIPIGTSATIKSVDETGKTPEEVRQLRNDAVRGFLDRLTGKPGASFRVIGEEIREIPCPAEARWAEKPLTLAPPDWKDGEAVRKTVAALGGLGEQTPLEAAARGARIIWFLNDLLAKRPLSLTGITEAILAQAPERKGAAPEDLRKEALAALVAGSALSDEVPGAIRLRTHRFVRGGWQFHRCVDPTCGKVYATEQDRCECGKRTAPLYICRSCGADTLRFRQSDEETENRLVPNNSRGNENERILYDHSRLPASYEEDLEEENGRQSGRVTQVRGKPVLAGSFDPETCCFAVDSDVYPVKVVLSPGRSRCLCCGASAGAGSILTPVSLGTSAAVRVLSEGLVEGLSEQHGGTEGYDGKERLLIFADSRQDAAHQARFIRYAGRYDRMRRRLYRILKDEGKPVSIEAAVQKLAAIGIKRRDNPNTGQIGADDFVTGPVRERASYYEEAPLLDDLAVSAGYRATILNLGLVGVRYEGLEEQIGQKGEALASRLGISTRGLAHLCRCLLDEMRVRWALSRPLLTFHWDNEDCPKEFREASQWERRTTSPNGYACEEQGEVCGWLDNDTIPAGIRLNNSWRKPGAGGRSPSLERKFRHLLKRLGSPVEPDVTDLLALLTLLKPTYIAVLKLYGFRKTRNLLQVNADAIQLELAVEGNRYRCSLCNTKIPFAYEGAPCPSCTGIMQPWPDKEVFENRYVKRILNDAILPLVASEHTAQVTGDERIEIEEMFKSGPEVSPLNVLACSPTLEMGIDVGQMDAVVMRNVPPRPDNYAQRGGRAGRRSRVGLVLGYARSTPHDGYFYDKPQEMIAGEVPAPSIGLGNRDVLVRHLNAIAFGVSKPGIKGRMIEYIDIHGNLKEEAVKELIDGFKAAKEHTISLAMKAWDKSILEPAGLDTEERIGAVLEQQEARIRDTFARVQRQVKELQQLIDRWYELGNNKKGAFFADELKRKLLGLPDERRRNEGSDADDRTSGHPMRRFAEFGILPGYEFPSEPASLRLMKEEHEEEPITVERRFGLIQFQPDASVHARGHKWKVIGLDPSSPWNPKGDAPSWVYVICKTCHLRYDPQEHAKCPRCQTPSSTDKEIPAYDMGGFLARRDDTPVLEEEDRFAARDLLRCNPQYNGQIAARFRLPTGWHAILRRNEYVRWINESIPPTAADFERGHGFLHPEGRGFQLCPVCGRILKWPEDEDGKTKKGRKKARQSTQGDPYGHAQGCGEFGRPPQPFAMTTATLATTFRIAVDLPPQMDEDDYRRWGYSLGYSLQTGIRHLYMLEGSEIEFELEPMWEIADNAGKRRVGSLTLIDPAVGGSGFLDRACREFHLIAKRAIEHLDHRDCESACYRCLKTYRNQRYHEHLNWPHILPDLESLASCPPEQLPTDTGDDYDPRPWVEAYNAGVGSPLELAFLRVFEANGMEVEKQVPVSPDADGKPISVADFVVKGKKTAIYIDGATFHTGSRLRRDRYIRDRLRAGTLKWRVIELTAGDLRRGDGLISVLKDAS